jgi:hypothetical protein
MNKISMLWCALVICLCANVMLLWKNFGPSSHAKREPKHYIIEKLNFDAQQCEAYEVLIAQHRQQIGQIEQEVISDRRNLYLNILDQNQPNESLVVAIADKQAAIERIHYQHFYDIKLICTPDQMGSFEILLSELPLLFNPKKHHSR